MSPLLQLLQTLLDTDHSINDIAGLLGVTRRTVYNKMRDANIAQYTNITEAQLRSAINEVIIPTGGLESGNWGANMTHGLLRAKGIRVPLYRVKHALREINPVSSTLRWSRAIRRRVYNVRGPMHLCHIDSHHKLIRWRIVTHGCVYGSSRFIIHLHATDNNMSDTVLSIFQNSTSTYGVPSRTRGDRGSENTLVHRYMEEMRGSGRGSYIAGRSVHNQRI